MDSADSMAETHRSATSFSPSDRGRSISVWCTVIRSSRLVRCISPQNQSSPSWGRATVSEGAFCHIWHSRAPWALMEEKPSELAGAQAIPATKRSASRESVSAKARRTKAKASSICRLTSVRDRSWGKKTNSRPWLYSPRMQAGSIATDSAEAT